MHNVYNGILLYRLLFSLIILPVLQSFNFCLAIGGEFKNMPITFKNEEVNYEFCQNYSTKGCIFDEDSNETLSCVVLDYFASLNYKLVSTLFKLLKDCFYYFKKLRCI
jgi:hypothetical protein